MVEIQPARVEVDREEDDRILASPKITEAIRMDQHQGIRAAPISRATRAVLVRDTIIN